LTGGLAPSEPPSRGARLLDRTGLDSQTPPPDAANVGADKDSDKRQRVAIEAYAKSAGFTIVGEYYDKAVSGADRIDQRRGFAEMLQRLASNGAKTIIVESPDRFGPDDAPLGFLRE
jgi:hypothetical protein